MRCLSISYSDGEELRTFEVADESGIFHPANNIKIGDNCVIISSKEVQKPTQARYGWQPYSEGKLINEEGLPASTFEISIVSRKDAKERRGIILITHGFHRWAQRYFHLHKIMDGAVSLVLSTLLYNFPFSTFSFLFPIIPSFL